MEIITSLKRFKSRNKRIKTRYGTSRNKEQGNGHTKCERVNVLNTVQQAETPLYAAYK